MLCSARHQRGQDTMDDTSADDARKPAAEHADTGLFRAGYLNKLGFKPDTVLDIGVRHGTRQLYRAFPDAHFILVDPQKGGEALLKAKPTQYSFVNKAVGSAPGTLTLHEEGGRSSLLERTKLTAGSVIESYDVAVTTIDAVLDEADVKGRIGLKIDTEGFELEALKGVTKYWDRIDFIICEASVRRRFVGSYQFSELVAFLLQNQFCFYNFLNEPARRPRYYDILFVPGASPLLE